MPAEPLILPLALSQLASAAEVMAQAFFEDPFFLFTISDEARRRQVLPWLYQRLLRYGMHYGKVHTTASLAGTALWLGPSHPDLVLWGTLWTGMCLLLLKLAPEELKLNMRLSSYAANMHRNALSGPHWYLYGLGVDPSCQGQGIGQALLQPILAQADRDHLPCYLDTNNERNIPFYERSGFEVVLQGRADPAGPRVWGMLRQPGKSQRE